MTLCLLHVNNMLLNIKFAQKMYYILFCRMKNSIVAMLMMMLPAALTAQTDDETAATINALKLDEAYVSADANDDDGQVAYDCAMIELDEKVCALRRQHGLPPVDVADLSPYISRIDYRRAGRYAVFVYMEKEKALDISAPQTQSPTPQPQTATPEQPAETAQDPQPETPAAQQPRLYDEANTMMLMAGDGNEAYHMLSKCKQEGMIADFGIAKKESDIPQDAFMLLVSGNDRTVSALISPQKVNLRTGAADDIHNYKDHAVVWYK